MVGFVVVDGVGGVGVVGVGVGAGAGVGSSGGILTALQQAS